MSFTKTHQQCYEPFKNHLLTLGFTLYPTEFNCIYSAHPLVDIAARMGCFYWAFEYKSLTDSVSRGVDQVRCYSEWFDYVVLVSEKEINHRTSYNYWRLRNLGVGLWTYDPFQDKRIIKTNPVIQSPAKRNHLLVSRRFNIVTSSECLKI